MAQFSQARLTFSPSVLFSSQQLIAWCQQPWLARRQPLVWLLILLAVLLRGPDWQSFKYDSAGYYHYLPALVVYNSAGHEFYDRPEVVASFGRHLRYDDLELLYLDKRPDGSRLNKYTLGVALLVAPFFLVTHGLVLLFGGPATGFGLPYILGVVAAGTFYGIMALRLIQRLMRQFNMPPWLVVAVPLLLLLATNLTYYVVRQPAMSHVYSLFLFAAFCNLAVDWLRHNRLWQMALMGLCLGLIILIRPTNGIIALFPLLIYVASWRGLGTRLVFIGRYAWQLPVALLLFALPLALQMLYWKAATGSYLVYSYNEEGFNFLRPMILHGLFHWRNGWLLYSPVMMLALAGLWWRRHQQRGVVQPLAMLTALHIYIIFSWWCWWYGGCYGMRPMIEFYSLLGPALGMGLWHVSEMPPNHLLRRCLVPGLAILILMNLAGTLIKNP